MAIRLNKLLTGHTITDELFTRTSSTALGLEHDTIRGTTDLEIWTGAGKTGTKLTITTDYTVSDSDTALTSEAGVTIYTKVAIVNGTYQNVSLYANYKTVGDYNDADDINFNKYTQTITANYTALSSDKTILVNTNNAITVSVTAGLPIGFELEIQRISSGLTVNAVTLGFIGETLNGVGSFAIFGNSVSAKTTKRTERFVIRKITSTTWAFVSGEDSGANIYGSYVKNWSNTLTCNGGLSTTVLVSNIAGAAIGAGSWYFYYSTENWVFPALFTSAPLVISQSGSGSVQSTPSSASSCDISLYTWVVGVATIQNKAEGFWY